MPFEGISLFGLGDEYIDRLIYGIRWKELSVYTLGEVRKIKAEQLKIA
jgi:hypothetical protein